MRFSSIGPLTVLGLAVGLAGCGAVEPVATFVPINDPEQLFMSLAIEPSAAINLSTAPAYATVQLSATPRNALGAPLAGLPAPVFHLLNDVDSTEVVVTPSGLVTARAETPSSGVRVVVELRTSDNVRRTDTAMVKVVDDPAPPTLARISVHPVAPDSVVWGLTPSFTFGTVILFFAGIIPYPFEPTLSANASDASDAPISGLAIEYATLDSSVAVIDRRSGDLHLAGPGHARLVARTTAYGVTKADTVTSTVTWPMIQGVFVQNDAAGAPYFRVSNPFFESSGRQTVSEVTVAPGGYVFWLNYLADTVDVTFDDPTNVVDGPASLCDGGGALSFFLSNDPGPYCGTGNFLIPGDTATDAGDFHHFGRVRRFPVPGIYPYRSTRLGITGRVVVRDDVP